MSPATEKRTSWECFQAARRKKGLTMEKLTELAGLNRSQIWGMLNGVYGQPDTPEKRTAILAALNEGPGNPVSETDIWPDAEPEPAAVAD